MDDMLRDALRPGWHWDGTVLRGPSGETLLFDAGQAQLGPAAPPQVAFELADALALIAGQMRALGVESMTASAMAELAEQIEALEAAWRMPKPAPIGSRIIWVSSTKHLMVTGGGGGAG